MFWNPKMLHLGGALLVLSTTCSAMQGEKGDDIVLRLDPGTPRLIDGISYPAVTLHERWDSSRSSPRNADELLTGEQKKESESDGDHTNVDVDSDSDSDDEETKEAASKRSRCDKYYWPVLLGILGVASWYSPVWKMATNDGTVEASYDLERGYFNSWERVGHTTYGLGAALFTPEYSWIVNSSCPAWQVIQTVGMVMLHLGYPAYNFVKRYGKKSSGYYCAPERCVCDDSDAAGPRREFLDECKVAETKDACEAEDQDVRGVWTKIPEEDRDCPDVWYDSSYFVNLQDFNWGYTVGAGMIVIAALVAWCFRSRFTLFSNKDGNRKQYWHRALMGLTAVAVIALQSYAVYLGAETMGNPAAARP